MARVNLSWSNATLCLRLCPVVSHRSNYDIAKTKTDFFYNNQLVIRAKTISHLLFVHTKSHDGGLLCNEQKVEGREMTLIFEIMKQCGH